MLVPFRSTITSHLSTQLEPAQFVCTQLVGAYFRFRVSQIAITCVLLQLIGTYFRFRISQIAITCVSLYLIGVYFRFRVSQIAITCVSLQPVGAYFRVQGFSNRLCFATMLVKVPSEMCGTTGRRSWNGLLSCLKKLRTRHLELPLDDSLSLKTCCTYGLIVCAMPNCLSRHLSTQPKRKAFLPVFPFRNPISRHLGNG